MIARGSGTGPTPRATRRTASRAALLAADDLDARPSTTPDAAERRTLAAKGHAMPDGSFPVKDVKSLRDATHAIGRAHPSKRKTVARHIAKRARQLGAEQSAIHAMAKG